MPDISVLRAVAEIYAQEDSSRDLWTTSPPHGEGDERRSFRSALIYQDTSSGQPLWPD
jgi:hypothetical protein